MFRQPLNTPDSAGALKTNPAGTSKLPLLDASKNPITLPLDLTTGAQAIHVAEVGAMDEVYLWASNYSSAAANILISIDDSSYSSGKVITAQLSSTNGLVLVYPGIPHNGQTIYVKASAGNAINVVGFIVRNYSIKQTDKQYGYHNSGD